MAEAAGTTTAARTVAAAAEGAAALDLSRPRRVHITNVGGAGMSAVAALLAESGHRVSGHDPADSTPFLAMLAGRGVTVSTGDTRPPLPPDVDAVVVSTATGADDPDVVAARAAGTPVLHRSAALAALCAARPTVAVAGTHGKTTTTALLATILAGAGRDPGWVVGAAIAHLGASAAWGGRGPLVVEADESDGTFLALGATTAVVTNVEPDHLENWGGEAALRDGFRRFVAAVPDRVALCADDPGASALLTAAAQPVTYGLDAAADYRIVDPAPAGTGVRFTLAHGAERVEVLVPAAPGVHNARNAAGALAVAHGLGVPLAGAAAALAGFRGVARRFELRGEAAGVTVVDSYDHLPTEVAAALAAAAWGQWRRVVAVFQPHRYSRTEALWRTFADAFVDADLLAVTGIYPAGELARPGVSGKLVADAVLEAHPWASVAWLPGLDDVLLWLRGVLQPGDLCLTLGAGDLTGLAPRIVGMLEARG
ncbi:MAG TPA: UDP-N-acetylmuramate--L-alanine ligase [Acidimicrobiales bacterium]|nr:UDP-N-acetylmuramate--L-alanine ligase [Acidimicrobiales bacterium]